MSTNGNLEDLKLLRIQVMEDVGADDQIWIYQEGCIKCRVSFGQETWVQSLGREDSPGEGNGYALQYSCLESSMD